MSPLERIVAACGGLLLDDGTRALIPGPNHSHKDRSVSLRLTEEGRVLIHCFSPKDDWREVRRALAARGLLDDDWGAACAAGLSTRQLAAQPADEERIARARRIWDESRPIAHTLAETYLRRRAIAASLRVSTALRFHAQMTSLEDRVRRPALIAAITDPNGALQGVQVTLLSAHGAAKAPVGTARRVIGKLRGGVVRLHEAGAALVVGEGVETMLSASQKLGLPAWSALSADNLTRFVVPACVRQLVVAVDNDAAGVAAASALKGRLASSIPIETATVPAAFNDFNDWARG